MRGLAIVPTLLLGAATVLLSSCGGEVVDANATPSASAPVANASQPAPGATPSADTCQGFDPTVDKGQPDDFNEGKDAPQTTAPDGLAYVDLRPGTGDEVKAGQCVTVNYSLFLADSTALETSRAAAGSGAFQFKVGTGQVIKGWDEGVPGMKVGGRRRLTIPGDLAYGAQGSPPKIPPNATLVFVVEVYKVR
ncbi:MAG: hypothetical protein QOE92_326 [Chloroflexota bacterium]|jgi:FKBP-type peptidyl-prolyl cis-trans isomerase|nr:hypothetical protein [Chloroflexota bacterium]